jgi:NAD(P)-dependent dehydrogenase (short-subunit alcohol dehydrogenase family)
MTESADLFDLTGRVALVTGAGRGLGASIADALERQGATVFRHVRALGKGEISRDGNYLAADLADPAQVASLASGFPADRLDVLVNNAGVEYSEDTTEISAATFTETMLVNAWAPAHLIGAFTPLLAAGAGGSVINVTSLHAAFPYPGHLSYAASKSALELVTRTTAVELGGLGIRVNSLCPGIIETDINRAVLDRLGRDSFASVVPLARVGSPEDLIGPAIFLASDASRYVSGATLVVDGGYAVNLARYGAD